MADIYAIAGLTPERMKELREQGLDPISQDFETLDIPAPGAGEKVVGELTQEEAELTYHYMKTAETLETMTREAMGEAIKRIGEAIKHSSSQKDFMEQAGEQALAFTSPEEEQRYCRLSMLLPHLKAMLYFTIGERLQIHQHVIGIRSKRRIVIKERRLQGRMVE